MRVLAILHGLIGDTLMRVPALRALKEAQMGFARVAVTGAGVPDQHAKALYYLGRCAAALGAAGKETNGQTKANQYFKDVEQRYPGTRWARLARESLP